MLKCTICCQDLSFEQNCKCKKLSNARSMYKEFIISVVKLWMALVVDLPDWYSHIEVCAFTEFVVTCLLINCWFQNVRRKADLLLAFGTYYWNYYHSTFSGYIPQEILLWTFCLLVQFNGPQFIAGELWKFLSILLKLITSLFNFLMSCYLVQNRLLYQIYFGLQFVWCA